jgi:hypothetical protein
MNVAVFQELFYVLNFDEVCFHSQPLLRAFLQHSGTAWCMLWGIDPLLSGDFVNSGRCYVTPAKYTYATIE